MYVGAVRLTDVSINRVNDLLERIEDSHRPPEGLPARGLELSTRTREPRWHRSDRPTSIVARSL